MSGQLLRQILASALFAVKFLLLTQNEEFIHLAALLTVVLKNRHRFPLMFSPLWNNDTFVKSPWGLVFVIPAKAGIQLFQ